MFVLKIDVYWEIMSRSHLLVTLMFTESLEILEIKPAVVSMCTEMARTCNLHYSIQNFSL